jgi:hypothetical protein
LTLPARIDRCMLRFATGNAGAMVRIDLHIFSVYEGVIRPPFSFTRLGRHSLIG